MAVTGRLGDEEIILKNAAEEETLKKILDVLEKRQIGTSRTRQNLDVALEKTANKTSSLSKEFEDLEKSAEKTDTAFENMAKEAGNSAKRLGSAFGKLGQGSKNFGDFIDEAGGTVANFAKSIPVLGTGLKAAVLGFTAALGFTYAAAKNVEDNFYKVAKSGASFSGSLLELRNAGIESGYLFEQFSNAVSKNIVGISRFAGSATKGSHILSQFLRTISDDGGLQNAFMSMGISLDEHSEYFAEFLANLSGTGITLRHLNNDLGRLSNIAFKYQKDMTILAELTGKSADQQREEHLRLQADAGFQAAILKYRPEERLAIQATIGAMTDLEKEAFKQTLVFGTAIGDTAKAMAFFPGLGNSVRELMETIDRGNAEKLPETFASIRERDKEKYEQDLQNSDQMISVFGVLGEHASVVQGFRDTLIASQQNETQAALKAGESASQLGGAQDQLSKGMRELAKGTQSLHMTFEKIGTYAIEINAFGEGLEFVGKTMQKLPDLLNSFASGLEKMPQIFDDVGKELSSLPETIGNMLTESDNQQISTASAGMMSANIVDTVIDYGTNLAGENATNLALGSGITAGAYMTARKSPDIRKNLVYKPIPEPEKELRPGFKKIAPYAKWAKRLPVPGLSAAAGYIELDSVLQDETLTKSERKQRIIEILGSTSGSTVGAFAGGIAGSAVPGVGTVLGGIAGGVAGHFAGDWLAQGIAEYLINDGTLEKTTDSAFKNIQDPMKYMTLPVKRETGIQLPDSAKMMSEKEQEQDTKSNLPRMAQDPMHRMMESYDPQRINNDDLQKTIINLLTQLIMINKRGFDEEIGILNRMSAY